MVPWQPFLVLTSPSGFAVPNTTRRGAMNLLAGDIPNPGTCWGWRWGADPRVVLPTTPRPTKLIRKLIADPTVVVTRGSTYENSANLAPAFLGQIVRKYKGTWLRRQRNNTQVV